jgi:hypothetical protein
MRDNESFDDSFVMPLGRERLQAPDPRHPGIKRRVPTITRSSSHAIEN